MVYQSGVKQWEVHGNCKTTNDNSNRFEMLGPFTKTGGGEAWSKERINVLEIRAAKFAVMTCTIFFQVRM